MSFGEAAATFDWCADALVYSAADPTIPSSLVAYDEDMVAFTSPLVDAAQELVVSLIAELDAVKARLDALEAGGE